ncbi:hypothetical protein [Aquimarina pacifica]|uniref:hypothetical protein n=1 Tax=Aquimarina pacifica TaxID=1296415 RepID=UPI00046F0DE0|nr:hypothetical protein [Aquimarina pacifica]
MLTYQNHRIQKVLHLLDGMHKIDIYEILQQIEMLLIDFSSPIDAKTIIRSMKTNMVCSKNSGPIGDRGYWYLFDSCQHMNVVSVQWLLPVLSRSESLYFTLPGASEFIPLDNRNVEETFSNMHLTVMIHQFLKEHNVKKRNPKTNRLLLLELFDHIDPDVK